METTVREYIVVVAHDTGRRRIRTAATGTGQAKDLVARAESCPMCAIQGVWVVQKSKTVTI